PQLKQKRRKKANRRLIFLLFLFFLIFICIIYFQSPLSRVQKIDITGNYAYTKEELVLTSAITKETNIWNVDKEAAEKNIEKLPEIKKAKVMTQLPNGVKIEIEEWRKIAYILEDGHFLPILEKGEILAENHNNPP